MTKDTIWQIPDEFPSEREKGPPRSEPPSRRGRLSPAAAASLSLFVWGAGQLANRQTKLGDFLIILMMLWVLPPLVVAFSVLRDPSLLTRVGAQIRSTGLDAFTVAAAIYALITVVWIANVLQAYCGTSRHRTFTGLENHVRASAASCLLPGWGQILNGQPRKACLFLLGFAAEGGLLLFLPLAYLLWDLLDIPSERLVLERILLTALLVLPFLFILHTVSVYDAGVVALHPGKRDPLLKRLSYTWNRWRLHTAPRIRGFQPWRRLALLLLILSLTVEGGRRFGPVDFYAGGLRALSQHLRGKGMTLLPARLDQTAALLSPR